MSTLLIATQRDRRAGVGDLMSQEEGTVREVGKARLEKGGRKVR